MKRHDQLTPVEIRTASLKAREIGGGSRNEGENYGEDTKINF